MAVPSIKGTAYNSVHDDLQKMRADGRIKESELEARMSPEELEVLDSKVLATRWYPIDTYRKMLALVAEKDAKGRVEDYLVERGWRAAERLKEAGIYRQLGADEAKGKKWGARVSALVSAVSGLMYNFTKWSVEDAENPDGFRIVVEDAEDLVDECRFTAQGFVKFAATLLGDGASVKISSARPTPDRIVYTIRRS
ncbi:MAG TPA: hypothetical protein VMR31_08195 [Myxococcota bacterium]|nr:hypothetical protein [Myxococcota bacterium]